MRSHGWPEDKLTCPIEWQLRSSRYPHSGLEFPNPETRLALPIGRRLWAGKEAREWFTAAYCACTHHMLVSLAAQDRPTRQRTHPDSAARFEPGRLVTFQRSSWFRPIGSELASDQQNCTEYPDCQSISRHSQPIKTVKPGKNTMLKNRSRRLEMSLLTSQSGFPSLYGAT